MSTTLSHLDPNLLWQYFQDLCNIPRPSKHEELAIKYVKDFAVKHGLYHEVDSVGNVMIRKPATRGMETRQGIVLQAHLDMVPQKNEGTVHDFMKDPIKTRIVGDWVVTEGTTLGADNGIGVAAALAVLSSRDIEHGPVEALLTIDEETGMTGAFNLKPGMLEGTILLNLDSEDEGEIYIGCAGGINATATIKGAEEPVPEGYSAWKISLRGLKGGHSGMDINLGRGNANKILNRLLWNLSRDLGLRVSSLTGGSLRNAIPREAFATVIVPLATEPDFLVAIEDFEKLLKSELTQVEPDLDLSALKSDLPSKVMEKNFQDKVLNAIYATPNGVIRNISDIPEVVETSTNLATVKIANGTAEIMCLLRSSVDTAKTDLAQSIEAVYELAGGSVVLDGSYPGWKPNVDSPILKVMKDVYAHLYNKNPEVKVVHAGLECGIIGNAYPSMDMVSFGPTIRHPHSPDEKVCISTVKTFWDYLLEVLKNSPEK
jgi:dipeptidase D